MIEVRQLCFCYDEGTPILRGIDLQIAEGSYVGVVGSNGSGKTTLTKHFNALLLPQSGEVLVDGCSTLSDPDRARRSVGMVLQNPDNQIVGTVVEDDVAFGPENLQLPHEEIGERVSEALRRVGLSAVRTRGAETLSGGQKQRLAIAGILAMRPRHVVVDEPTSMLDPVGREEVQACLRELHQEGITVIHVTHLLEELLDADRILAMEKGLVVFDGKPRDLFRNSRLMERLKLELPVPAALALTLEREKGVPNGVPWELESLCGHLGGAEAAADPEGVGSASACDEGAKEDWEAGGHEAGGQEAGDTVVSAKAVTMEFLQGSPLQVTALSEVNFSLRAGELLGLVGSTGSGKSTLIQVLAGLVEATRGTVTYREGIAPKELFRTVGVVFQHPEDQLFENTVFEDVAYGPKQLGMSEEEIRRVVPWALDLLGLPTQEILNRSPFELSGGEKRRVAIAGILSMQPQVLILDEPTAGLDAEARQLLLGTLRRLHEGGETTVLMVSHNMELLSSLASRMVLLSEGKILADGTPREIFGTDHDFEGAGLHPPYPVQVMRRLQRCGWDLASDLFQVEEVARALGEGFRQRKRRSAS